MCKWRDDGMLSDWAVKTQKREGEDVKMIGKK